MSKNIGVFGSSGMLGSAVVDACLEAGYNPVPILRDVVDEGARLLAPLDAAINCSGIVTHKVDQCRPALVVKVNGVVPHIIRWALPSGCHFVQVSTDCVFSGRAPWPRLHSVMDLPDPVDLYGRSKLVGEVGDTIVRTSFIGLKHGLLRWFLDQPEGAEVPGYRNAYWSGSTVKDVARALVEIAVGPPLGLVHLACRAPTNKYELLWSINRILGLGLNVVRVEHPRINRAMQPTIELPPLLPAIEEICSQIRAPA